MSQLAKKQCVPCRGAEEQAHHPDVFLSWGHVRIQLWTHKIDGLTESDFIMAAKIDDVLAKG